MDPEQPKIPKKRGRKPKAKAGEISEVSVPATIVPEPDTPVSQTPTELPISDNSDKNTAQTVPVEVTAPKQSRKRNTTTAIQSFKEFKQGLKTFWPWTELQASESFTPNARGNEVFPNVMAARNFLNEDHSVEFSAVLSENYLYCAAWTPMKWEGKIIGMKSNPIPFRRELKNTERWANLFDEMLTIEGVLISNFADYPNSNVSTFELAVFDPQLMQAIDSKIQDLVISEYKEYIERLRNPLSSSSYGY